MKKSTGLALNVLVNFAIQATNADDLDQYFADNYEGIVDPLQLIGDFDLEPLLDTAMYTLWLTASTEADEITISQVVQRLMNTLELAWQEYNQSVDKAFEALYGEVDKPSAVEFLNSCLQLDAE